jgi:tol-pal system protein YbgF
MTFKTRTLFASALGALTAASLMTSAFAQGDQDKRIDRLEKEIRELRAIVFQGRDTGQPVVVKPAGPDPAIDGLQTRADQQDQTIRTLSGRVEVLGHDLDEAKHQIAADHDAETELRGEVKELTDQLTKLQAPPQPEAPAPTVSPSQGSGGAASAETAAPPLSEAAAFKAAKAKLTSGDFAGGGDALNGYIQQFPSGAHMKEAYYFLGESYYARSLYSDATVAYARALKDWPHIFWAADATLKLARALQATNRPEQACAALAEFEKRYAAGAPRAVRARAEAAAVASKCSG